MRMLDDAVVHQRHDRCAVVVRAGHRQDDLGLRELGVVEDLLAERGERGLVIFVGRLEGEHGLMKREPNN